jgi:hypothetical protein
MTKSTDLKKFERDQVCYEQNCEHARSLNIQMNGIPVLAVTLTGGLWFGVVSTQGLGTQVRFALLAFAGICNIALALSALRIRDVFQSYIERIEEFNPSAAATGKPKKPIVPGLRGYSMISLLCSLMFLASGLSFFGAFEHYWPFEFSSCFGWGALAVLLVPLVAYLAVTFCCSRCA